MILILMAMYAMSFFIGFFVEGALGIALYGVSRSEALATWPIFFIGAMSVAVAMTLLQILGLLFLRAITTRNTFIAFTFFWQTFLLAVTAVWLFPKSLAAPTLAAAGSTILIHFLIAVYITGKILRSAGLQSPRT